jgi:D-alanyl-lipoteichoic acid acyltransferase DltB (MBOAT superfamily)
MIFTTPEFVAFFALFFGLLVLLPASRRKYWLLLASYAFYASWNPAFVALLAGSTGLDFAVGRAIHRSSSRALRRALLAISVAFNLGVLGTFKYFDFFSASVAAGLGSLGLDVSAPLLDVILPVGISFYTFQSMSYTIDIYRGSLEPTPSLLDFAVFVAAFPQLVAGPIERAARLLPQISELGRGALRSDTSGFGLIALGVFKKAVVADNLALVVDAVYSDPANAYAPALWLATYAFALQIYFDFSGYSDIAVGLGRLMGLNLMQNFEAPYAAAGPAEFWRRWHISLSTWLRDYLYIPLSGNRGTWLVVRRNLLITMLLGGLWHGAAWNFVLWGLFHAALLVVFRWEGLLRLQRALEGGAAWLRTVSLTLRRFLFFHATCLGWALFRAESLQDCTTLVAKLLDFSEWRVGEWVQVVRDSGETGLVATTFLVIAALVVGQNLWPVGSQRVIDRAWRAPLPARFAAVALLVYLAAIFGPPVPAPFIYFAF